MGINRQDDDTFTLGELRKIRGMDLKPKPVPPAKKKKAKAKKT
jgi:hypothetical protein